LHVVILEIIFVDILRIWQIVGHITDEEEVYGEDEMEETDMDDTSDNGNWLKLTCIAASSLKNS
jgi:hypothetical protein